MGDHERHEELAALFAGGFLSEEENKELCEHVKLCPECLTAEQEFDGLFRWGLLAESPIREFLQRIRTQSDHGIRERFVARARREGLVFSPDVQKTMLYRAK